MPERFKYCLYFVSAVSQVYAALIKDMWSDGYVKVVPREFKTTIGACRDCEVVGVCVMSFFFGK